MTISASGTKSRRRARSEELARLAIAPLSTRGVKNVTLAELGEELGMTGANLLYYFESKTDLFMASLRAVERDFRENALANLERIEGAQDRWDWLADAAAPRGLRDSTLLLWLEAWALAVHDPVIEELVSALERDWQGLLRSVLEYGVERGELPADLDLDSIVEGVSALQDGLTIRVLAGQRGLSRDASQEVLFQFCRNVLPWRPAGGYTAGPASAPVIPGRDEG